MLRDSKWIAFLPQVWQSIFIFECIDLYKRKAINYGPNGKWSPFFFSKRSKNLEWPRSYHREISCARIVYVWGFTTIKKVHNLKFKDTILQLMINGARYKDFKFLVLENSFASITITFLNHKLCFARIQKLFKIRFVLYITFQFPTRNRNHIYCYRT